MELPVLTPELALRLEKCDTAFIASRVAALQKLANNPYGAELRDFVGATGMMVRRMSENTQFNRVGNLTPAQLDQLDAMVGWYQENGSDLRFDLLPSHFSPDLSKALTERGFYQSRFYSVLYGLPEITPQEFPGVTVRLLEVEAADLAVFDDIFMAGFGFPEAFRGALTTGLNSNFFDRADQQYFLACVDGTPAGLGILLVQDKLGYLTTATTLPQFRGRGCQKALIQQRILAAKAAGCELVTTYTMYANASQTNMEKLGLRLAYNKAVWTKLTV